MIRQRKQRRLITPAELSQARRANIRPSPQGQDGTGILDTLLPTRQNFPPKVREAIKKYGPQRIKLITVGRKPVQKAVTDLYNWLSEGKYEEQVKKLKYDNMFHLFMIADLEGGPSLLIEKNSVINIKPESTYYAGHDAVSLDVPKQAQPAGLTLQQMIDNAVKAVGPSIYLYDLVDNNCQKFITDLLKNSGLLTPKLDTFINQDVKTVINGTPTLARKIANFATEAAAKLDRFIHGEGKKKYYPRGLIQRAQPAGRNRQRYLY